VPPGSRRRLRAADIAYAAGISSSGRDDGVAGGGGETAYPVREAPGLTAGQRVRVRASRFGHRLATVAVAVRRLPDLGTEAVG
jgi:hypothetical protein